VGKYHCVMFHIDNLVTLTSPPDGGSCAGGTEALDMFGGKGTEISVSPAGATITPNPGVEVDPWIYFSDSSLASNSNNCYAPNLNGCPCSGPCPLTALTIPVTGATHTLVLNLNNRISGSGISCTLVLPVNGSGVTSAMSIR
jgi:hypothetical protein